MSKILSTVARAKKLVEEKSFDAIIASAPENIQYLTSVSEPSVHACAALIIGRNQAPTLVVMWLDEAAARKQAVGTLIKTYTPYNQDRVIAETLEVSGIRNGKIGMDGKAMTFLANSIRKYLPDFNFINADAAMDELRWVKTEAEINLIKKSCRIADKGMKAALESLKPGITELEIAALAEKEMIYSGSDELKHRTMVASGYRTGLVHPFATQKKILKGELVTVDMGAVYRGYCSDIARTAFMGKPTEQVKRAFEALQRAQEAALDKIRPKAAIKEVEEAANKTAESLGCKLIGHVGHSIGLRTEEDPHLWSIKMPTPKKLEKNMVLALFQSAAQMDQCVGPRLEDTLVVSDSGAKVLTAYPQDIFRAL